MDSTSENNKIQVLKPHDPEIRAGILDIVRIDREFRIDRNRAAVKLIKDIERYHYTWQAVEAQLMLARADNPDAMRSWTDARINKWAHGLVDLPANEELWIKLQTFEVSLETAIHRTAKPHRVEHVRTPDQVKELKYLQVLGPIAIRWREHRDRDQGISKAAIWAEAVELYRVEFEKAYRNRHQERTLDVASL
jgi:hypothetical protein